METQMQVFHTTRYQRGCLSRAAEAARREKRELGLPEMKPSKLTQFETDGQRVKRKRSKCKTRPQKIRKEIVRRQCRRSKHFRTMYHLYTVDNDSN